MRFFLEIKWFFFFIILSLIIGFVLGSYVFSVHQNKKLVKDMKQFFYNVSPQTAETRLPIKK